MIDQADDGALQPWIDGIRTCVMEESDHRSVGQDAAVGYMNHRAIGVSGWIGRYWFPRIGRVLSNERVT